MELLLLVVGGVFGAAGVVVLYVRAVGATTLTRAQRGALQQLAARRGGTVISLGDEGLEFVVDGVAVRVGFRWARNRVQALTQVKFVLKEGPAFDVAPVGVGNFFARQVGAQDLHLGVAAFDAAFVVKGWDHEGISAVWSGHAQTLLYRQLKSATVCSDGLRIELSMPGDAQTQETLDAMLDAVLLLASVGTQELAPFEALPGVSCVPAGGTWDAPQRAKLTVDSKVGDATAWLHWALHGPRMTLKLGASGAWQAEKVALHEDSPASSLTAFLPEDAPQLRSRIGRAHLVGLGPDIRLEWHGVPSTDAFRAGLELLVGMATRARESGVYR